MCAVCIYYNYTFGTVTIDRLMDIVLFLRERLGIPEHIGCVFPGIISFHWINTIPRDSRARELHTPKLDILIGHITVSHLFYKIIVCSLSTVSR